MKTSIHDCEVLNRVSPDYLSCPKRLCWNNIKDDRSEKCEPEIDLYICNSILYVFSEVL